MISFWLTAFERAGVSVYKRKRRGEVRYGLTGVTSFSYGQPRLLLWLSGPALTGALGDRSIYSRFEIGERGDMLCDRTFPAHGA
jgi:hypothetical protein